MKHKDKPFKQLFKCCVSGTLLPDFSERSIGKKKKHIIFSLSILIVSQKRPQQISRDPQIVHKYVPSSLLT